MKISLFKSNKTKWMPLGHYNWGSNKEYIIFVRGNLKTGLLDFKSISTNHRGISDCVNPILPRDIIDTRLEWNKIYDIMGYGNIQQTKGNN
jgi:hypothetical protein